MNYEVLRLKQFTGILLLSLFPLKTLADSRACESELGDVERISIQRYRAQFPELETAPRIILLTDLPHTPLGPGEDFEGRWKWRMSYVRLMAEILRDEYPRAEVILATYPSTGQHGRELPDQAWVMPVETVLTSMEDIRTSGQSREVIINELLSSEGGKPFVIALTQYSASGPLTNRAREFGFRGTSSPGITRGMLPGFDVDKSEVLRRVTVLQGLLDSAQMAELEFTVDPRAENPQTFRLQLDLRNQPSTGAGANLTTKQPIVNAPEGESWVVPIENEDSRSQGILPIEHNGQVVLHTVNANRIVESRALGHADEAAIKAVEHFTDRFSEDPNANNIAEFGNGVLGSLGVTAPEGDPSGQLLLIEKLGVHIALGRSDYFAGGTVMADSHIDYIYTAELQPRIRIASYRLVMPDGSRVVVMTNGEYVESLF